MKLSCNDLGGSSFRELLWRDQKARTDTPVPGPGCAVTNRSSYVKRALTLGIVSSVLCLSVAAQAEEAFTAEKAQIGVGLGYGMAEILTTTSVTPKATRN
jgi:hypothetical protein